MSNCLVLDTNYNSALCNPNRTYTYVGKGSLEPNDHEYEINEPLIKINKYYYQINENQLPYLSRTALLIRAICEIAFRIIWFPINLSQRTLNTIGTALFYDVLMTPKRESSLSANRFKKIKDHTVIFLQKFCKISKFYLPKIFKKVCAEELAWDTLSHFRQGLYGKKEIICFSSEDISQLSAQRIHDCAQSSFQFREYTDFFLQNMLSNTFTKQSKISDLYYTKNLLLHRNLTARNLTTNFKCINSFVNLRYIWFHDTELDTASISSFFENIANLPSLSSLFISTPNLTTLPSSFYDLPNTLVVNLSSDSLLEATLRELHVPGRRGPRVTVTGEPLDSLENYLQKVYGPHAYPQRLLQFDEKDALTLRIWLSKRVTAKDYGDNPQEFDKKVKEVLDWLAEETDKTKIRQAFALFTFANQNCCDQYASMFNKFSLLRKKITTLAELKDHIIICYRLDLIDEIANAKIAALGTCDPVEVHLGYETHLNKIFNLDLPIKNMQFLSRLTPDDIKKAVTDIQKKTDGQEKQALILSKDYRWKAYIEKQPNFAQTKKSCEEQEKTYRKDVLGEKVNDDDEELTDEEYQAILAKQIAHKDEFNTNSDTIWNPYWILTKEILNSNLDTPL